jgi:uncharacterized C2H2 Zn-finger protein
VDSFLTKESRGEVNSVKKSRYIWIGALIMTARELYPNAWLAQAFSPDNKMIIFLCFNISLGEHKETMGPHHTNKCLECDMILDSWTHHQEHLEKDHNGAKMKTNCGQCGEIFNTCKERLAHTRKHHGARLPCTVCGIEVVKDRMKVHL